MKKTNNVIRGKFRLGENSFPSSRERTEKIMNDIQRINKKWNDLRLNDTSKKCDGDSSKKK